jgi:O-antigen/teichoic acid export membrane protein
MLKRLFKDSVIYTIPTILSAGLAFLLLPIYTRVLGPANYGSLDLLIVFSVIANKIVALEVTQGLARYYSTEENQKNKVLYASSAFWFAFLSYSLFAITALLLTKEFSYLILGQSGLDNAYQIGIFYIWTNGTYNFILNQFRWELKSREYAIAVMIMSFSSAALALFSVFILDLALEGILLAMFIGCAISVVYGLVNLRDSLRLRFSQSKLLEMLAFSWPFVISGLAVWISGYIDRMMINHFLGINEVGLYAIGFKLASIVVLAMVGFQGALTPLVYANLNKPDTPTNLAAVFRYFTVIANLSFIVLTLFSQDIIALLATPSFNGGASVVIYLIPAAFLSQMYIFAPGIGISKKTHIILWINILGAILNAALNFIFIPMHGINGAAFATLAGYSFTFLVYMAVSQSFYRIPHRWMPILFSCGSAIILVIVAMMLSDSFRHRLIFGTVSVLAFILFAIFIRLIEFRELRFAIKFMKLRISTIF